MSKKVKKDSAKLKVSKIKKLDKGLDPEHMILEDEDEEESHETVVDETVDPEILKVLKPARPKPAQKPVVNKLEYIAELERDEVEFDDL